MRLDRDSKQPIWLGLLLVFAAFIFTLFFITRVHASEVQTYGYNNVIIISGTGQRISFCFADGSFGLRFSFNPTDEDDGYNIYTHEEFEQRFNDFFAYVLASQTYIVFYDDYVAKGTYEYLEEYFLSKGCGWVLTDAVFPITFPDSFSLMQGHAGMWFFPYYTRSVPLSPSATPSPTPTSSADPAFSVIIKNKDNYFLYDVFGSYKSVSNQSLSVSGSSNNALSYVMSTYGTDNVFSHFVWFAKGQTNSSRPYYGNNGFLYFPSDGIDHINSYSLGTSLVSSDLDFLRSNYVSSLYGSYYYSFSSELSLGCIVFNNFSGWSVELIYGENLSNLNLVSSSNVPELNTSNGLLNYSSNSSSNLLVQAYRFGLGGASSVSPTPDPNAPSPSPSPTEAPHVIINWPSGTPSPTPPFSVSSEDSGGGGSGSPGGSSHGSLTSGQVNSTLNTFKQYTQNNGAFAFLYACTSLIPDDALYFLFILLFILLLLACLRLFVHFTGG